MDQDKLKLCIRSKAQNVVIDHETDENTWAATVHINYNTLLLKDETVENILAQAISLLSAEVSADITIVSTTKVN